MMTIAELGCTPIVGGNPTGEDVRYDPLFEALQTEVDIKPSAGTGGTNWNRVQELSETILETKSKDILVASYLAVGLLHTKGLPDGLLDGVTLLKGLVEQFWDTLFPPLKRMRGRAQAIGWWLEKTTDYLGSLEDIQPLPAVTQQKLVTTVDALFTLISEKCQDAPSIRRVLEYTKSLPVEGGDAPDPEVVYARAPEEQAAQSASKSPQQRAPQSDPVFTATAIADMDQANRLLASVIEKNYLLIDFMLSEPTMQPSWYHLNLLSAWFDIQKLPPATGNKTLIPPPDRQITNSLVALKGAANWNGTLKNACFSIRRYPFWLDMNRCTVESLGALGEQYKEARQTVERETLFFIQRFAGIESYTFNDGTPFADPQTANWLRELDGAQSGGQPAIVDSSDDVATRVAEGFDRCRELFTNGKQGEGLTVMHEQLRASGSARERYLWRLSLVRLLSMSGMEKLALPHLNELMKDYDLYHLEEWDPAMALNVLRTVWNGLRTQEDQESKKRADEIMSRISMLSPSDAFNLVK
jgi:type VI secretion system protein VasJ